MEDDKMFELMEKMYVEMQKGFTEVRGDINGLKEDVSGLKEDVSGLKSDVSGLKEDVSTLKKDVSSLKKGQIRLENRLEDTRKSLFDGYVQNSEDIQDLKDNVAKLSSQVGRITLNNAVIKEDVKELKLRVITGGRDN